MNEPIGTSRHHNHHHKHHHKHGHGHKHAHRPDLRELLSRYFLGLAIGIGMLVAVLGGFLGWGIYQAHLYQSVYGPELQKELGFTTDSLRVKAGDQSVKVSVIHTVPGGYMDKIGFQDSDIITSHSFTEFYKLLYTKRGETTAIDLVDGGDGKPIEERKVKTLRFHIPINGQ